jgi:hypothetical protein
MTGGRQAQATIAFVPRTGCLASAVVFAIAIVASYPSTSAGAVRLVHTAPPGTIVQELSLSGSRLAWTREGPSCIRVYRYSFATEIPTPLTRARCVVTSAGGLAGLVLTGRRVYWTESKGGNSETSWSLRSTVAPYRAMKVAAGHVWCGAGGCSCGADLGTALGPTSGSSTTFVYSTHDLSGEPDCEDFGTGIVTGSRVHSLVAGPSGLRAAVVPNTPGAAILAYRGGRIALVPLQDGQSPTEPAGLVEVRSVTSGALISQLSPAGTIRALALSRSVVAVLVRGANGNRIVRYAIATGERLGKTPVPASVDPESLDIAYSRIVYRAGREIRVIRVETGQSRLVHRVSFDRSFTLNGVQIAGDRIVWHVKIHGGRSHIYQSVLR